MRQQGFLLSGEHHLDFWAAAVAEKCFNTFYLYQILLQHMHKGAHVHESVQLTQWFYGIPLSNSIQEFRNASAEGVEEDDWANRIQM